MNADTKTQGKRIYLAGLVKLEIYKYPRLHFIVLNRYHCWYDLEKWEFGSCECVHGSLYGVKKPEQICRHKHAIIEWMRENGQKFLREERHQKKLKA